MLDRYFLGVLFVLEVHRTGNAQHAALITDAVRIGLEVVEHDQTEKQVGVVQPFADRHVLGERPIAMHAIAAGGHGRQRQVDRLTEVNQRLDGSLLAGELLGRLVRADVQIGEQAAREADVLLRARLLFQRLLQGVDGEVDVM